MAAVYANTHLPRRLGVMGEKLPDIDELLAEHAVEIAGLRAGVPEIPVIDGKDDLKDH